jgi:hypothetical protein
VRPHSCKLLPMRIYSGDGVRKAFTVSVAWPPADPDIRYEWEEL